MPFNPLQFNELSLPNKIEMINKFGEYITHITENNRFVDLYLIGKYYVQVIHNESVFSINDISLISNKDERLELFLDKIRLPLL